MRTTSIRLERETLEKIEYIRKNSYIRKKSDVLRAAINEGLKILERQLQ